MDYFLYAASGCILKSLYYRKWTVQKGAGCDGLCRSMAERSYPLPKVRGGGLEEQPHIHGAVAVQEGREELLQVHSQEGRL